jgi:hypothetical protein
MEDLASRVTTRIQITTDGHRAYEEAVEGAFGMNVDHAMLISCTEHLLAVLTPATVLPFVSARERKS